MFVKASHKSASAELETKTENGNSLQTDDIMEAPPPTFGILMAESAVAEKMADDATEATQHSQTDSVAEEEAVDAEVSTEEMVSEGRPHAAQEATGEASSSSGAGLGGLLQQLVSASGEGPMYQTTIAGLNELGLRYDVQEPGRIIVFTMNCKVGSSRVIVATEEADKKFLFYIKTPATVPEEKRTQAALFLTWVNYGLSIGNFEMDMSDGEVRFKSSNHLLGAELSTEMVVHTVALCVRMIDQFFPGLMGVVYGDKDPKDAHDECMSGGRIAQAQ
ncbi:Pfam:DUF1790 [Seminavis robusta]|uniref:Pfam:DUF1790 n=1 Tax=Seminavis robusta TaxID=568900 RepID=A0A9N8HN37_9STRA|nr:Pfam:DUF1790 [Seminavis robusta]|eukprot:Sro953_g224260.1 Pfam:DUF1790 (276) ;mRNA; r:40356-41183